MPRRAAKIAPSSFGSTQVISSVAIWTSLGSRPADSAPFLISPRYSASDSSVSQFAITPSATSAAVPTIFGPRPASQIGETVLAGLLGGAECGVAEPLGLLHPGDQLVPGEVAGVAGEAQFSPRPVRIQSS